MAELLLSTLEEVHIHFCRVGYHLFFLIMQWHDFVKKSLSSQAFHKRTILFVINEYYRTPIWQCPLYPLFYNCEVNQMVHCGYLFSLCLVVPLKFYILRPLRVFFSIYTLLWSTKSKKEYMHFHAYSIDWLCQLRATYMRHERSIWRL